MTNELRARKVITDEKSTHTHTFRPIWLEMETEKKNSFTFFELGARLSLDLS